MKLNRRSFLWSGGALAAGFFGLRAVLSDPTSPLRSKGFGNLVRDPNGVLDLPEGFSYESISEAGELMDDGFRAPGAYDGMAAFQARDGRTLLVRNHELGSDTPGIGPFGGRNELLSRLDPAKLYDAGAMRAPGLGCTCTLVVDSRNRSVERQFLSLAGTLRNCAGGPTPWGSWLSCEETVQRAGGAAEKDHGFVFEVPASAEMRLADPAPLKAMGRFNHEAAAIDPRSGCVYLTEDRGGNGILREKDRGLGLLYRFIPLKPGVLAKGGRLQALKIRDLPGADTTNWNSPGIRQGHRLPVEWVDLEDVESPHDDLRHQGRSRGAAGFTRNEGIWYGNGSAYFCSTDGGAKGKGQVWRYRPGLDEGTPDELKAPGDLELFIEPNASDLLKNCDNLTVAPWGDLILCEDGPGGNFLVGVTPQGRLYKLAKNALNASEFAGATFAPVGNTLFVNIHQPGLTLAITPPSTGWSVPPDRL